MEKNCRTQGEIEISVFMIPSNTKIKHVFYFAIIRRKFNKKSDVIRHPIFLLSLP